MKSTQQRGQMLILVLWIMGLLSAAMGVLVMRSTHELRLGRFPLTLVQQRSVAEAAVWQAAALISHDDPAVDHLKEPWATGVDPQTEQQLLGSIPIGEGAFTIGVEDSEGVHIGLVDEQRKLNLNTAAVGHLAHLIEAVGPSGTPAQGIADAILDWRDEPVGSACASATPPCHNGPFDTVDELRLVPGMTPALFDALQPYVTVYGAGAINVNTASAVVLNTVGAPGDDWVQQRDEGRHPFTTSPQPGNLLLTVTSTQFTVPVETTLRSTSRTTHLEAIIDREGHILAWHPR